MENHHNYIIKLTPNNYGRCFHHKMTINRRCLTVSRADLTTIFVDCDPILHGCFWRCLHSSFILYEELQLRLFERQGWVGISNSDGLSFDGIPTCWPAPTDLYIRRLERMGGAEIIDSWTCGGFPNWGIPLNHPSWLGFSNRNILKTNHKWWIPHWWTAPRSCSQPHLGCSHVGGRDRQLRWRHCDAGPHRGGWAAANDPWGTAEGGRCTRHRWWNII